MSRNSRGKQARQQRRQTMRERVREEERRARKREEQRQAMRRAVRRGWFIVGATVAVVAAIAFVVVLLVSQDHPTKVTGSLSGVRDISFTEGSQPDQGISPVCGCKTPPVNGWRGVSFAARQLTLARTGSSPWTEWALSSADPDSVSLIGGTDWVAIEAVRFRPHGAFDPHWMLGTISTHADVVSRSTFSAYDFTLLTHRPLHVAMLGPVPVGAWVPYPGSQVTLGTQASSFPQDPSVPTLTERYPTSIGENNGHPKGQVYPLGDFLGPDLVLWTQDPTAQMPETPLAAPTQNGVITAFLIRNSAFAVRIAAAPLLDAEVKTLKQNFAEHPDPRQPNGLIGAADHGQLTLTVNQPLSSTAYATLRQHVSQHQLITLQVKANPYLAAQNGQPVPAPSNDNEPPLPWRYSYQERYPPLPLYAGFNVFGPLTSVLFNTVSGHVSIGDQPVDLSGAPDLQLSGVQGLRNANDEELLSAPLATSNESADLAFRAVASVRVNGALETSWWKLHGTAVAIALAIVTVIGTLLALITFVQTAFRTPGKR